MSKMSKNLRNRNFSIKLNAELDKTSCSSLNGEIFLIKSMTLSQTFNHYYKKICKKLSSFKLFYMHLLKNILVYVIEKLWMPVCQRQLSHLKCLEKRHSSKLTKLIENNRSETDKKQIKTETLIRSLYEGFIKKFMAYPK
jgi:hypothetical protein